MIEVSELLEGSRRWAALINPFAKFLPPAARETNLRPVFHVFFPRASTLFHGCGLEAVGADGKALKPVRSGRSQDP
jgi:hypothetical protein